MKILMRFEEYLHKYMDYKSKWVVGCVLRENQKHLLDGLFLQQILNGHSWSSFQHCSNRADWALPLSLLTDSR